jgi:hypothetical protein
MRPRQGLALIQNIVTLGMFPLCMLSFMWIPELFAHLCRCLAHIINLATQAIISMLVLGKFGLVRFKPLLAKPQTKPLRISQTKLKLKPN